MLKKIIKNPIFYIIIFLGRLFPDNIFWDKIYLKMMYRNRMRKKLDIENPKTFNEKLNWLKINDRNPIYTKLADKYEVKEYVKEKIGKEFIIPTLGIWSNFDDINFDELPERFVLKCTHDSGGIVIVKNKREFDKKNARKKINHYMKRNYYKNTREWPYKNIKPRIMAEPYLEERKHGELRDYKFYMFNNKLALMFICSDRKRNVKYTFFDSKGNLLNIHQCNAENDPNVELPKNLELMIELSKKLSKDIVQVRVDFYEVDDKIFFRRINFF